MKKRNFEDINFKQEFPETPECVFNAVKNANQYILQKEENKSRNMSKKAILLLAAVFTLFSGMTAFAATTLWQQRMENMNEQEMLKYFYSITASNAPAFRYNREMTADEKQLFEELKVAYETEGKFPEGMLLMLSGAEEYNGKNIGYEPESGTFFLPQENLTVEQMLQIIDFYHKVDYSLQKVSELATEGKTEFDVSDASNNAGTELVNDFQNVNNNVSCYTLQMEGAEMAKEIAAGADFIYLGYEREIRRIAIGERENEIIYKMEENEKLYAIDADKENNIYLSLRKYDADGKNTDSRLLKIDKDGKILTQYAFTDAISKKGKELSNLNAYKMVEDKEGRLFVKTFWSDKLLLFVFNEDGSFNNTIEEELYEMHPASDMCIGKDGNLYVLGKNEIICIDTEKLEVQTVYTYIDDSMNAAMDIIYPIDEKSMYLLGYDGLYKIGLEDKTVNQLLKPYETSVLQEGMKCYPIDGDVLVVANRQDSGMTLTYFQIIK